MPNSEKSSHLVYFGAFWHNEEQRDEARLQHFPEATEWFIRVGTSAHHATTRKHAALDALRALAKGAGMKMRVKPYAVSIIPLSQQSERLFVADCTVPPEVIGITTAGRADLKPWLESNGVKFPPGSSVAHLPTSHKLVVRQTRANLDKIKSIPSPSKEAQLSKPES